MRERESRISNCWRVEKKESPKGSRERAWRGERNDGECVEEMRRWGEFIEDEKRRVSVSGAPYLKREALNCNKGC